jgi:hypothetical protein
LADDDRKAPLLGMDGKEIGFRDLTVLFDEFEPLSK